MRPSITAIAPSRTEGAVMGMTRPAE
jgi:hypothetical protein